MENEIIRTYSFSIVWRRHRTVHGFLDLELCRAHLLLHNPTLSGLEEGKEGEEEEGREERRSMTWTMNDHLNDNLSYWWTLTIS